MTPWGGIDVAYFAAVVVKKAHVPEMNWLV